MKIGMSCNTPTIQWFSHGARLHTLHALDRVRAEQLAQIYWLNELHSSRAIEHVDYETIFI
jgi:hypothetical protein